MRKKPSLLFAVACGTVLCAVLPATTFSQDKFSRLQEQPQVVVRYSPQAIAAVFTTTVGTDVAGGTAGTGTLTGSTGIEMQLLTLLPVGSAHGGSADAVDQSDRIEILVTLPELPPDLLSPRLIAEIHEGTCRDLKSDSVRAMQDPEVGYSLAPSVFSLRSFSVILPVSFAALRNGAHAVTVHSGPRGEIADVTCVDIG